MSGRISSAAAWVLAAATFFVSSAAFADNFPSRPVRMIVPFSAGGPTDLIGRLVGQHLSDIWGQPVVADNRGGAGGLIGIQTAIRAAPDGYTLLFGSTSTFVVNPAVYTKLPYSVERDLRMIAIVAHAPQLLVVRAGIQASNVQELVAIAKKQPGKLKFASSGVGTTIHMAGELLKRQAGIDILHVPYKGGGQAVTALLGGEADMLFNNPGALIPHIKAGRLKALAVAGPKRSAFFPDLPTFAEGGLPGVESGSGFGFAAPAETPRAKIELIRKALARVVEHPRYKERLATLGTEPILLTGKPLDDFLKREFTKWSAIVKAANIRRD